MTYLAPLKKAVVDDEGTMRLHYWPKNDLMKGPKVPASHLALLPQATNANGSNTGQRQIAAALNNRNGTIIEAALPNCRPGAIVFKGIAAPPPAPTPHYKPVPNVTYTRCGSVRVGVSYNGHDIPDWKAHDVGGVEKCCEACAAHSQCKCVSYHTSVMRV